MTLRLTAAAEGIYRGQLLDPAYPGYWTAEVCEIVGPVDVERLSRAIAETVVDAEVLHTRYVETDGRVGQIIDVNPNWQPEQVRVDGDDPWPRVKAAVDEQLSVAADLTDGQVFASTVFRCADRVFWHVQAHHIALDGFGYAMLYRQVSKRYARTFRESDGFGELSRLVEDDAAYHDSDQWHLDRRYWLDRMSSETVSGFGDDTAMPLGRPLRHEVSLPPQALEHSGHAWPHRLLAAVAAVLHRHTGVGTVVLGLSVAGRLGTPAARIPGMVMNIAPLVVPVAIGDRLSDVTVSVAKSLKESRRHHRYRYEQLRRDLGVLSAGTRLFGPVVNVIPFAEPPVFTGCDVVTHHVSAGPVDDIAVTARGSGRLTIEGNAALYTQDDLRGIAGKVEAVLTGPDLPVGQWLPVNGEALRRPVGWTRSFTEHVATGPDAVAVVEGDRQLTYGELDEAARRAAGRLVSDGVAPGDLVAIAMPRGIAAVVSILAAWYAGAAYLPVDPLGAGDRNNEILAQAKPRLSVTGDRSDAPAAIEPVSAPPDGPAYVIYTSGSTGHPKGVVVPRSALEFFAASASQRYPLDHTDRVLQFAPLHFDAHVEELFVSLSVGATLVIRDDSAVNSLPQFVEFLAVQAITVLDLPTAYWHELVLAMSRGLVSLPASVRLVIIGGEAVAAERVRQWHRSVKNSVKLINTYGPTEATVVCLAADLDPGGPTTLGRPLPGVKTAIGPGGELYLAGPGLAGGYLGMPDDERFLRVGGERFYRTGDLVSVLPDGQLEYRGRVDSEVKISGHRIHPAEVEAALLSHPQVREAAVTVDRTTGSARLIGHVTADDGIPGLTDHLKQRLPAVAIPSQLVFHDRLMRTSTGKIDRKVLTTPLPAQTPLADSATQRQVLDVFTEVLGRSPETLESDFFAAGGSSLSAVSAAARLSTRLERDVTAALIFAHPSVRELSAALDGRAAVRTDADDEELMRTDSIWTPQPAPPGTGSEPGLVLSGATGFVGAHLLAELLADNRSTVYALARGGMDRLAETARYYGLPSPDPARVHVIECDFAQDSLALTPSARATVTGARAIIHCAADVSLSRGYRSLRAVNVQATRALLELAWAGGSHFHHVSTVAVGAGMRLPEDHLNRHDGLRDGYQQSKWVAEELVRAAAAAGLSTGCYRLGRVVSATDSASRNPKDLISQLITAGLAIGALPDLPVAEPWIRAGDAAHCIGGLVGQGATGVWNLTIGEPVRLNQVWKELRQRHSELQIVPLRRWLKLLSAASERVEGAAGLEAFFASHDSSSAPPEAPRVDNERFTAWLKQHAPRLLEST